MGLLSRVTERGKAKKPSPVLNTDKNIVSEKSLIKQAEKYSDSLYSFYSIFAKTEKYSEKCTLLLKVSEQSDILYPLAVKGFDKTTTNRLRINLKKIRLERYYPYHILIGEKKEMMHMIFSTREYDLIESIVILVFKSANQIFGCLFLVNVADTDVIFLQNLTKSPVNDFFRARYNCIPKKPYTSLANDKFRNDLDKLMEKTKGDNIFHLYELDFTDYFTLIEHKYPYINHHFILHDAIQIISNLFESSGNVYSSSSSKIVTIFQSKTITSSQLVSHQILLSVNSILPFFKPEYVAINQLKYPEQADLISEKYR